MSTCFSKEAGAEHMSKDIFLRHCEEGKHFSAVDFFFPPRDEPPKPSPMEKGRKVTNTMF